MAYNVIEVRGAVKHFGETHAVDGVDLTVQAGELFGLIGHNGAGKTTLFKMMLGLLPVTRGEIYIDGQPVRGEAFRQVRRGIGYLPESLALYDNLSGLEVMLFFAKLKDADPRSCLPLLEKVGLANAARRRVRGYSKGMRQRLGFAQALLGSPRLLFLDEPTNGLDPQGIREFYQILRELQEQGVTAILTSHILAEIQLRVDRLALMRTGKIQALGTVHSLREELNLPLDFQLTLQPGAEEALRQALANQPAASVQFNGTMAHVRCPRERKMTMLNALAALDSVVLDLHIKEPSLEDVFLGYSDATA
ncbi:MAG: ABC transporter ATP-binding protein [Candidatus Contendobacter sp.]|nr:ABC transporter ATP-binding protein [Candidatus Contendobacter sp.]